MTASQVPRILPVSQPLRSRCGLRRTLPQSTLESAIRRHFNPTRRSNDRRRLAMSYDVEREFESFTHDTAW